MPFRKSVRSKIVNFGPVLPPCTLLYAFEVPPSPKRTNFLSHHPHPLLTQKHLNSILRFSIVFIMFKSCWLINIFNLKKRRDYSQIVFLEVVIQIFWGIKWKAMWKTRSMFNKTVNFSRCHSFHFPIKESKNKNKQKRKRRFKIIIGALTIFQDSPPLLRFGILLEYPLPSPLLRAYIHFEWPLTTTRTFGATRPAASNILLI